MQLKNTNLQTWEGMKEKLLLAQELHRELTEIKKVDDKTKFFKNIFGYDPKMNSTRKDLLDDYFKIGFMKQYYVTKGPNRKAIFDVDIKDHENGEQKRYDILFLARKEQGNSGDLTLLYLYFYDKIIRDKVLNYLSTEPEKEPLIDGKGNVPLNIPAIKH